MPNPEYFFILCGFLALGLVIEFGLHLKVYKSGKERLVLTLITFVIGVVWDTFALSRGHWFFPPGATLGPRLGLMPIEEYFFILVIPYSLFAVRALVDKLMHLRT